MRCASVGLSLGVRRAFTGTAACIPGMRFGGLGLGCGFQGFRGLESRVWHFRVVERRGLLEDLVRVVLVYKSQGLRFGSAVHSGRCCPQPVLPEGRGVQCTGVPRS